MWHTFLRIIHQPPHTCVCSRVPRQVFPPLLMCECIFTQSYIRLLHSNEYAPFDAYTTTTCICGFLFVYFIAWVTGFALGFQQPHHTQCIVHSYTLNFSIVLFAAPPQMGRFDSQRSHICDICIRYMSMLYTYMSQGDERNSRRQHTSQIIQHPITDLYIYIYIQWMELNKDGLHTVCDGEAICVRFGIRLGLFVNNFIISLIPHHMHISATGAVFNGRVWSLNVAACDIERKKWWLFCMSVVRIFFGCNVCQFEFKYIAFWYSLHIKW